VAIINHCKLGLMATCMKADNPIMQRVCHFSNPTTGINRSDKQYCMRLRRDLGNHCDSASAQQSAKEGNKEVVEPLTEKEVFDVRNPRTYPEYGITY